MASIITINDDDSWMNDLELSDISDAEIDFTFTNSTPMKPPCDVTKLIAVEAVAVELKCSPRKG